MEAPALSPGLGLRALWPWLRGVGGFPAKVSKRMMRRKRDVTMRRKRDMDPPVPELLLQLPNGELLVSELAFPFGSLIHLVARAVFFGSVGGIVAGGHLGFEGVDLCLEELGAVPVI